MFGRGKPKPVVMKKYRALTSGGARKDFEKDAAKMIAAGYEIQGSQDKSHWYGTRGDITVTYVLRPPVPPAG